MMRRLLGTALLLLCLWVSPAWAVDPDGTEITAAGGGSVVSNQGTFSFGATAISGPPDKKVLLNGSPVGPLYGAVTLRIDNRGELYAVDSGPNWWIYIHDCSLPSCPNGQLALAGNTHPTTIESQVHNAPGWIHSHTYTLGQRVNNGPGWNEGLSKFVPYSQLRAYEATDATCVSAASGGPTTTVSTAPYITDGTCHWKYKSDTDYVTLTGWANDSPPWSAGTYGWLTYAAAGDPLTTYQQTNPSSCVSSITPSAGTLADGCTWVVMNPITYTSGNTFIPWTTYDPAFPPSWHAVSPINSVYQAALWNDREYVIGANGEVQYMFKFHVDVISPPEVGEEAIHFNCNFFNIQCPMTITTAPGESFADYYSANPSAPLTGPDQGKGVLINGLVTVTDNGITWRKLQLKNASGPVILEPQHSCNPCSIESSIVESQGNGMGFGGLSMYLNSLFIVHGAGSIGLTHTYPGISAHNTIVSPEGNGGVCDATNYQWIWPGTYFIDNACFGFAHSVAGHKNFCTDQFSCMPYFGYHNFIGAPSDPEFTPTGGLWGDGTDTYTRAMNNTVYNVNPSDVFVTWPGDYRLKSSSPLKGAGAAYGSLVNRCAGFSGYWYCPQNVDPPDIFGSARPATGQDVGAWQTPGAAPSTYTITVASVSNGTVTSSPAGISCPGTCSASFSNATNVTLTETPNSTFVFTGWGGNCSGNSTTCPLTSPNQFVTATFAANNPPPPPPVGGRTARLNVYPARNPGVVTGLLEMPSGITGTQTVDVGTGPQNITVIMGATPFNPRPTFYVTASDGVTDVQVTSSTTNPMKVTYDNPDNLSLSQTFVFRGNWGITISKIKIHEMTTDSMFGAQFGNPSNGYLYPAVTVDTAGRGLNPANGSPYGQAYYYFGPKLADSPSTTSKGLTTGIGGLGHPEVAFEPCNLKVPYVVCPPNFTDAETVITGVKKDGVTQSPGTLSSFISADHSVAHTYELPAGTFVGTGPVYVGHTIRGQGMGVTILDDHGIQAYGFKGIIDLEGGGATIADMTIKNALGAINSSAIFNTSGLIMDHVELTQTQVGIHGGSFPSTVLINNSNVHDNGNDNLFQHELYINGGFQCMFNNNQIIAGERPDHAIKTRCPVSTINGGQVAGCLDPYEEVCGSVIDFSSGTAADIQGMYSEKVAGTIHTGDVLTMTFHSLVDSAQSDIVVTSTVGAGPPTAAAAATALLTALQGDSSLLSHGFYFSAAGTAKSTDTSDTINIFAPGWGGGLTLNGGVGNWTFTPSVTGSSHTTTLTQTLTPAEIVLTANVIVANGSSEIIRYASEAPNFSGRVTLNHVHITNLSATEIPLIRSFNGGELHISDCKYAGLGGVEFVGLDKGWTRVYGSCVSDSVSVDPLTISADGTTSLAGAGADLITQEGTWHWGTAAGGGNFHLLLNGVDSGLHSGWVAAKMRVDHNGTMFAQTAAGVWATYHGGFYEWHTDVDPTLITADATVANQPSGTVNTWEGTWSFGSVSGSDRVVLLNGAQPLDSGTAGVQFKVAHGGRFYMKTAANVWYIWDGVWTPATPP